MDTEKSKLLRTILVSDDTETPINSLTEKIIGCAFNVSNSLGCGFLKKVYENALAYDIRKQGLKVEQQKDVRVFYDNVEVGFYSADLLVENMVLVELKTVKTLDEVHKAQCLNYLKATSMKICLLINFGNPRVEIKRVIL